MQELHEMCKTPPTAIHAMRNNSSLPTSLWRQRCLTNICITDR